MRTTKKDLNDLLLRVAELSNLPTNIEEAQFIKSDKFLALNSVNGGYILNAVDIVSHTRHGVFGFPSYDEPLNAKEMAERLKGLIAGLSFAKNKS